jgi:hypothetical protein
MMTSLLRRLRAEQGIALPVAMILMMIMIGIALGVASYIDTQSAQTGKERKREVTFNLAEAALNAQVYQLSQRWPGQATQAYGTCSPAGGSGCPSSTTLQNLIPAVDTTGGATWQTQVFDDSQGLESFFADSRINGQQGWDTNGDGKVWVRAQATVGGKTRAIVSLVRTQMQAEVAPHAAVIAQSLDVSNNGQKTVIAAGDTTNGAVDVRCTISDDGQTCLAQPLGSPPTQDQSSWYGLVSQQINPPVWQDQYNGPTFSADELQRFIATAQAFGTYYTYCPPSLTGNVVVIAGDLGQCKYNANSVFNSQLQPGFLIILNSGTTLLMNGGATFYGVVYYANQPLNGEPQNSGTAVTVQGTAQIIGGVIIDGPAGLTAGSSGGNGNNTTPNIVFNDSGFGAIQSLSSTNIIPNSWREIQPGQ